MLQESDLHFMRLAIAKAKEGIDQGQTPFAACIVRDGKVLSCEHNVVWATTDITAHGEIHAIREACKNANSIDLSGCVLYSTCEPCPMCFSAIHWSRIEKVFYGASIADAKAAGFHELTISNAQMKSIGGATVKVKGGILLDENQALFKYFNSKQNKKVY